MIHLSNQKVWDTWQTNNQGPYGQGVMRFAERWAVLMENSMASGADLPAIAERTSHEADTEGITGFMYGAAVSVLASCWEHGEELRRWHNLDTQIGNEGELANKSGGVLNPAVINVAKDT